jgi:hypothetical protein
LRRLLAFFVLCALPVIAVAAPKATPTAKPSPTPTVTPTPPAFGKANPVVMIFQFETPSDLDPKYGNAIANIYAQVLSQSGGVTVLAIPPVIKREDYQTYAHIHHADYYISGYIQPIGSTAAIVSQVVDVNTDISVYSATTQVADVTDIGSQALNALTVIRQAAGVDRPQIGSEATAAPEPTASSGASYQISSLVGDLFKGKGATKGKGPAPTPTPAPPKPDRGVIVAHLLGNATAQALSGASNALYFAMNEHYKTSMTALATKNLTNQADSICGSNRNNTIASGTLNVQHLGGFHPHDSYTFTFDVYACFGAVLYTTQETNGDYNKAIRDAVQSYYEDHPENNG